jgi:hypothetical protein
MGLDEAAQVLSNQIDVPFSSISVFGRYNRRPHIHIWCDPRYLHKISDIPKEFEGFPVVVESRPQFMAPLGS